MTLIPYLDFDPLDRGAVDCAPTAAIVGRTVAGPGLVLRSYATLRADGEWVRVGAQRAISASARPCTSPTARCAANIGDDVTVGRFALVHACTVEDRVVVGDAATRHGRRARRRRRADHARAASCRRASSLPAAGSTTAIPRRRCARSARAELAEAARRDPPAHSVDARHGGRVCRRSTWRRTCRRAKSARLRGTPAGAAHASADAYVAPTALLAGDVDRRGRCERLLRLRARRRRRPDRDRDRARTCRTTRCSSPTPRAATLVLGCRRHDRPQRPHGRRRRSATTR